MPYSVENAYSRINTSTTTVCKAGSGMLHTITFSAIAATATINVFDNTAGSGTVIFSYTGGAIASPITVTFDTRFNIGLTVVTAVAAVDMTVSFS